MEKTIHSPDYRRLIAWLQARRQEQGLSMRELAERLGVSHSWVGKIEQLERRLDVLEYVRLCRALKVSPRRGIGEIEK